MTGPQAGRGKQMPGMFGDNPPLLLVAIAIFVVAIIVFAFITAG